MSQAASLSRRPVDRLVPLAIVLWGCATALILGLAVGNPTPATLSMALLVTGLLVFVGALRRPFAAYLCLAASAIILVTVVMPSGKGLNLFDLLLPPLLIAGLLGGVRQQAASADALESGARRDAIRRARRRLSRAVIVYYGLAIVSVVPMFFDGRSKYGTVSSLALARAIEGLLLFPVGLWLLRSERRIRHAMTAMFAATVLLLVVNVPHQLILHVKRAGMTWFVNQREWPIADSNEAGAAMVIIIALTIVLHTVRPRWYHAVLAYAAAVMLVLTYSRSGLLALLTFGVMLLRRVPWWRVVRVMVALVVLLPLIPSEYWERLGRTLMMRPGTGETYSSMIRFLSWKTAASVFLHHPLFGVGYLGLFGASPAYNELRIMVGAESYGLEIAADLGIIGLTALGFVIARLLQLGRAVRQATTPGSIAHVMAAHHTPVVVALMVANLTGSNFIGVAGLGQLALWTAMMVRAGHEAVNQESSPVSQVSGAAPA